MVAVVLFHSILGLRSAEAEIAGRFRAAGHAVTTPDLYEGWRTDRYDAGFAKHDEIGDPELVRRARAAVAGLPAETVLAGVSMGGGFAAALWAERPETRGVLLLHGPGELPSMPREGTPVQVHMAEPEPFDDEAFLREWIAGAGRLPLELEVFRYPGVGHFFTDRTIADYDAAAAELLLGRSLAFLGRI
jgi:dienelactone hydrolase